MTASDWDANRILHEYAQPGGPDSVERIARDYPALGRHRKGQVGRAPSRLIAANDSVRFGQAWLEGRHGGAGPAACRRHAA